jgi:glycosyltransferase involved in cell wall biosynthesis
MEKSYGYIPAKAVICPSRAAMAAQAQITPKLQTAVIYPSVDLRVYDRSAVSPQQEVRKELGLPPDKPVVGIVGRLQRWKGIHTFLQAAEIVGRHNPEVCFVVVGGSHFTEPDYPKELEEQVIRAGISERVRFAGHQTDVVRWLQAFDILVHASTREPFGMVIIEGMAMGKPVIAARAGGPTETIAHGENGLLVTPGDAAGLAAAMQELLQDRLKSERISRAAYLRARDFSSDRLAAEMADFLHSKAGT